jgi:addiction module RelE/StbE family toxin
VHAIHWSDESISDLVDILDYIGQRNASAAVALHARVLKVAFEIGDEPQIGRPGRVRDTREFVLHPNYLLVYRVGDARVEVLRILHARRRHPPV